MAATPIRRQIALLTRLATTLAVLTAVGTSTALAQSAFWSPTATNGGSWGTGSNWAGGIPPSGSGGAAGFVLDFNPDASVTLDGFRTIATVISTSANPWSIDPGTPAGALVAANFLVSGDGPLTINSVLAGFDFLKDGSGTLTLSNANNAYAGSLNIAGGTLKLVGTGNYSTNSNLVIVGAGATLDASQLTGGARFGGLTTRLAINNGDTLVGSGFVEGGLRVKSGGTVYPGINGLGGTLLAAGGGQFDTGSNWQVKLSSTNEGEGAPNLNNRISFLTGVTLADGMNMPIDGSGLTFTAGQTYDYAIASTDAGTFDIGAVNFQPTNFAPAAFASPANFSLVTSLGGSSLVLRFTPVPEPAATAFVLAGGVGAVGWWRRANRRVRTGR